MYDTFFCECCLQQIDVDYINSHYKFCELMSDLSAMEIEELIKEICA